VNTLLLSLGQVREPGIPEWKVDVQSHDPLLSLCFMPTKDVDTTVLSPFQSGHFEVSTLDREETMNRR
jgi:exosome complex RNA-binding protein Rrp4